MYYTQNILLKYNVTSVAASNKRRNVLAIPAEWVVIIIIYKHSQAAKISL